MDSLTSREARCTDALMKKLVIALLLVGCRNDAITFAKLLEPTAKCNAVETHPIEPQEDIAVCRVMSEIWVCRAGKGTPTCEKIRDVPAERGAL